MAPEARVVLLAVADQGARGRGGVGPAREERDVGDALLLVDDQVHHEAQVFGLGLARAGPRGRAGSARRSSCGRACRRSASRGRRGRRAGRGRPRGWKRSPAVDLHGATHRGVLEAVGDLDAGLTRGHGSACCGPGCGSRRTRTAARRGRSCRRRARGASSGAKARPSAAVTDMRAGVSRPSRTLDHHREGAHGPQGRRSRISTWRASAPGTSIVHSDVLPLLVRDVRDAACRRG